MKLFGGKGFCKTCQKFDTITTISHREDVVSMLSHFHSVDARHGFDGDVEVYEYEEKSESKREYKISDVAARFNEVELFDKKDKTKSPTIHHIQPRSRGGKDIGNTVTIPEKFHQALHTLFGNLTPSESVRFFEEVILA